MRWPSLHAVTVLVALSIAAVLVIDQRSSGPPQIGDVAPQAHAEEEPPPLGTEADTYPSSVVELSGGQVTPPIQVTVRVAHTPEQRRQGLMDVEELPDGVGMLFVFPEDTDGGFWMKDTRVPLDIAWIDAAGRVVATAQMDPCTSDPCPTYRPRRTYRYALEVRQDWFDEVGVQVGSRLDVPVDCAVIGDGDVRLSGRDVADASDGLAVIARVGEDRCDWIRGS